LQALIREVGALPGVRLAPVGTEANRGQDAAVRRQLLRAAYQDALDQAREVAAAVGLSQLSPLEVQLDGNDLRPMLMRASAAEAAPPFDPAELALPKDRLSLLVRFCAR
ncbi:SIMPL domain-containing protein, partial [Synechococcus sp. BA-132 BA5]|uniref:SIMPL domain-containing protein n=1 Tax=Synechococcus sp. BA-132 BA5 TaxID=3110252 RepID=UPI002B219105